MGQSCPANLIEEKHRCGIPDRFLAVQNAQTFMALEVTAE